MPLCLAQQFMKVRAEKGITQEEASRMIGVSLRTIQRWEHSSKKTKPSRLAQAQLKKALDILK